MKKQLLALSLVLLSVALSAQDQKQTFNRKVVLEQFTTGQCQYCPSGNDRIAFAVSGNESVVWMKHHAGFGSDALTNEVATAYLAYFGGGSYAPAYMLDRTHFQSSEPGPVMEVGETSSIATYVAQAKSVPTYCKVYPPSVTYNPETRLLSGAVEGRFGDDVYGPNTRVCVYIVEDSFYMYQVDAYNPSGNIYHMKAVRASITAVWGDPLEVDSERNFSHPISYTLPEEFVAKNCHLVALVYNYDPSNINNRAVLNAAESDFLTRLLGVGEVSQGCQLRLYPNPASSHFFVEADAPINQVTVFNAMGQVVLQRSASSNTLALTLDDLSAGLYLVRVRTSAGVATRQLMVQ